MPANRQARACSMPLFGIAGWSNAGKTTLIEKLTQHFAERGLRVATIKHTHHKFDIDAPGSDTRAIVRRELPKRRSSRALASPSSRK